MYSYCKTVLSMDGRLLLTLNESFLYLILTIELNYLNRFSLLVIAVLSITGASFMSMDRDQHIFIDFQGKINPHC